MHSIHNSAISKSDRPRVARSSSRMLSESRHCWVSTISNRYKPTPWPQGSLKHGEAAPPTNDGKMCACIGTKGHFSINNPSTVFSSEETKLMYWHMDETHQVTRLSMAPLWVFAHMEQHFFECCLCRFQHYHLYEPCQEHKSLGGNGAAMGVLEVVNDTYVGSGFCENLPPSSSQLYIYIYTSI